MPSSFFTRPKGLHPTPSACFPPPPPPKKPQTIARYWFADPVITMAGQIESNFENLTPIGPTGADAEVTYNLPGYYTDFQFTLRAGQNRSLIATPTAAPATITGIAKFVFANGQRRTIHQIIQINP